MIRLGMIFFSVLLILLSACTKHGEEAPPITPGEIVARPVGVSTGDRVEMSIGAEGGTLKSEDGGFELQIPPGALASTTTIGIEPITRTLVDRGENGSLPAYRLTPHGQQFQKPVTIRFHAASSSFAHIAYQDEQGKWRGLSNVQWDNASKTVSVTAAHFSDWATYESIFLEPASLAVETGKTATLNVMTVTSLALNEADQGKPEFFLEDPSPIPVPVEWRIVNGPGNGTIAAGAVKATATFTAPGSIPAKNPAEVEARVDLKLKGIVLLLGSITIIEPVKPGLHLRINGGEWIHFVDESFVDGQSYYGSDGDFPYDKHSIYFRIAGGKAKGAGTWTWQTFTSEEEETSFEYIAKKPAPRTSYTHQYTNNDFDIWHMSPGYVRITAYKADEFGDTWAKGQFLIEKSTPYIDGQTGTPPMVRIEGNFNLRVK